MVSQQRPEDWSLNTDQLNLATRFPADEEHAVAVILDDLAADGVLATAAYDADGYLSHADRVAEHLRHGGYLTYIFPEEARLLYAVADIVRPRRTLFVGSYYGYWAAFAMPGIAAAGGTAVLIDPNPEVLGLSRENLDRLGYGGRCQFVCEDAATYLRRQPEGCDLVVQDAEGPKTGADPDRLGKAIYYPLTVAATPLLRPGGLMVAHNIMLSNLTDNDYFRGKVAHNHGELALFHRYVDKHYDRVKDFPTTEGVGIYRRADTDGAQ
ncbi:MAG TPA: class I SAM-dependent methyltransferase [Streptosporangiaceae bacterium]|nr:class I SAM-dependent methyltransferase [Streptosporangiaceae bacterium]